MKMGIKYLVLSIKYKVRVDRLLCFSFEPNNSIT